MRITSGLAAVLLKNIVHFIHYEFPKFFNQNGIRFLLPLTPLLGILLSLSIIRLLFREKITVGLSNIIYRIVRKSSVIPKEDFFSHLLTSGVTVGFGSSAGLEAPIIATGAAIGSNTAKGVNSIIRFARFYQHAALLQESQQPLTALLQVLFLLLKYFFHSFQLRLSFHY